MSVAVTVLVFAVIPLGAYVVLAVFVYGPSVSRAPRYRPGRPWEHDPVWYVPQPEPAVGGTDSHRRALTSGQSEPPASVLDAPTRTARGGAHGSW